MFIFNIYIVSQTLGNMCMDNTIKGKQNPSLIWLLLINKVHIMYP